MSLPMPQILAPNLRIPVQPLEPHVFAPFGTVIQNPEHAPSAVPVHHNVVSANQGSALKYVDVSHLTDYYDLAPSKKPARSVINMFVCSPRHLEETGTSNGSGTESGASPKVFHVQILERHPFTSQTFIPTGLSIDDTTTRYLVVVAPTLPASAGMDAGKALPYPLQAPKGRWSVVDLFSKARSSYVMNASHSPSSSASDISDSRRPKGPGSPDLSRVKAFIANGSQSVTYGPGTWHAPMVVLGIKSIDFVVVQYSNGVALEDCQEIAIKRDAGDLQVVIDDTTLQRTSKEKARL